MFIGFFFFKQKTAYEMRISDWSSDVCSSDLPPGWTAPDRARHKTNGGKQRPRRGNGAARYACEWMTPDDLYQAGDRKPGPAAHAKPGGWHMDINDAHAFALQIVCGCIKQHRHCSDQEQKQHAPDQPRRQWPGD